MTANQKVVVGGKFGNDSKSVKAEIKLVSSKDLLFYKGGLIRNSQKRTSCSMEDKK